MAIITAAQARDYIPGLTGTGQDTLLETLISRAEAMISRRLHYPAATAGAASSLESTAYTHHVGRSPPVVIDGDVLRLPVRPVLSVTTIHDDPDWAYGASTLVASTDYVVDGEAGTVTLKPTATAGAWSTAAGDVRVVYTAGWSTDRADMQQAVGMLVQHLYRLRKEGGRLSVSGGQVSESLRDEEMPAHVSQIVDLYQLAGGYL